jgi:hypothetical protein
MAHGNAMEMVYIGPWTRQLKLNHQANDHYDACLYSGTQSTMRLVAIAVRPCQRSSQYVPVVVDVLRFFCRLTSS